MAPAGSSASLHAAIRAGADEVYMGISGFGARRFAENFSVEEYCNATADAHRFGTAVNITLNTILSPQELEQLYSPLEQLYAAGVDSVIIQDLGFADFLAAHFPRWPRHASTQLSIATPEEARWAEAQGFSRIVLARELSLKEIEAIRRAVSVELEVFASGALCIACSGKCFLSSFIGGRSGNRGMCTQPCRQKYRKVAVRAKDEDETTCLNDPEERFYLSSCDQWQELPEIARLYEMGVEIIKLEGRMKSAEYVFEAVQYYRRLIDSLKEASPEQITDFLKTEQNLEPKIHPHPGVERIFNRGYSKGYMYENDPDFINTDFSASWGVKIGDVRRRRIHLTQPLRHGDGVAFLDSNLRKIDGLGVNRIVLGKTGEAVPEAPRGADVELGVSIPNNARFLYKTYDIQLNRQIESEWKQSRRRNAVRARLYAHVGFPLRLELSTEILGRRFCAEYQSSENLNVSKKFKTSRETLLEAFNRFGETPFFLDSARSIFDFEEDVFVPKSILNELRQKTAAQLETEIVAGMMREPIHIVAKTKPEPVQIEVVSRNESENQAVTTVATGKPELSAAVSTLAQAWACQNCGLRKIYRLEPPVHFGSDERPASPFRFSPLAGSLFDAIRFSESGTPFALDWMFHTANLNSVRFYEKSFPLAETFFISPEISRKSIESLIQDVRENPASDPKRLGLVVYGYLYGMYTRKTLFSDDFTELRNMEGRPIYVTRNARSENPLETTGSRVYYGKRMNIITDIFSNPIVGLSEIRLDFTLETPEQVSAILKNVQSGNLNQSENFSYGYEKGIF